MNDDWIENLEAEVRQIEGVVLLNNWHQVLDDDESFFRCSEHTVSCDGVDWESVPEFEGDTGPRLR